MRPPIAYTVECPRCGTILGVELLDAAAEMLPGHWRCSVCRGKFSSLDDAKPQPVPLVKKEAR